MNLPVPVALSVLLALSACGNSTPPDTNPSGDMLPPPTGCPRAEDGGPCLTFDAGPDMGCLATDRCNGTCTDLQTDSANCGTCGTQCGIGLECIAAKCAPIPCPDCKCQGQIGMPGPPESNWVNAVALAPGDFNGDGRADLAAANYYNVGVLLGQPSGALLGGQQFNTDASPVDALVADFNGDKKLDFAVANNGANSVTILWGDGKGNFAGSNSLGTELAPVALAAGDVNGDGKIDLMVADSRANLVSVFLNAGGNTFAAQTTFATGVAPESIVAADFDGDGKLDLVTANATDATVSLLKGAGDGSFAAPIASPAGARPTVVVTADFNDDKLPDLALTNPDTKTISLLINLGGGVFGAPQALSFPLGVSRVRAADLDGDGKIDLVVSAAAAGRAGLFMGAGAGQFAAPITLVAGQSPNAIAVGDYNGDGTLDLAFAQPGYQSVHVLLGTGSAGKESFAAPTLATTADVTTSPPAAADLDGDGTPDVVASEGGGLSVLLDKSSSLAAGTTYAAGTNPTSIAIADFNSDGKPDLATANADPAATPGTLSILLNTGSGTFGAATALPACQLPSDVVSADLDGDGKLDLAAACSMGEGSAILIGKGDGTFTAQSMTVYTGTRPIYIALADFDGDGKLDLFTRSLDSQPSLALTLNAGKATFLPPAMLTLSEGPFDSAIVGDFDGDGHPDIAAVDDNAPSLASLYLNRRQFAFVPGGSFVTGTPDPAQLVTADFDGDGLPDLAAAATSSPFVSLLLQRCLK